HPGRVHPAAHRRRRETTRLPTKCFRRSCCFATRTRTSRNAPRVRRQVMDRRAAEAYLHKTLSHRRLPVRWWDSSAAVATAWLVGCAAAPQTMQAPAAVEPAHQGQTEDVAEVTPALVVDAQDVRPGSEVRCRDILKPGSNVIMTQCMTAADWERWKRHETRRAQALVRALQGGAYSTPGW